MNRPSLDDWLREAKADPAAARCGMYLFHTGVVRATPKAKVRQGEQTDRTVRAVDFSYDEGKVAEAMKRAQSLPGIFYVRVWLNAGTIPVNQELMLVLVGGDIRPRVIDALQSLVGDRKSVV